jgi:hypothetical protein
MLQPNQRGVGSHGRYAMDCITLDTGETEYSHVLRFTSLHNRGRAIAIPCDAAGHVDIESLTIALQRAYIGAKALVGREYGFPTIE